MSTFVLVHGAMHGGWCWRSVADVLTTRGHRVLTPTLTGQGERAHLCTPEVGVETHVHDLLGVLAFEGLHDVHLVCHSYAGTLAGPVVHESGRIARVTLLGAFVVEPGECLLDVEPPDTAARYRALAAESGDGWRVPASPTFLDQWGVTEPLARDWVGIRLTDFPLRCATDPVAYPPDTLDRIPCAYVRHTEPPLPSLDLAYARARVSGWVVHDLAAGHDMMVTAPGATADLLHELDATT